MIGNVSAGTAAIADEQSLRIDTAAFYRLVEHFRWSDLTEGYIVSRDTARPGSMFLAAYGERPGEIKASTLLKLPLDGHYTEQGEHGRSPELAAVTTSQAIFKARPDVHCLIHAHTEATIVFSSLACELLPVSQAGVMLHERISLVDFDADVWAEKCIGDTVAGLKVNNILLMRNHGCIVVGRDVKHAFRLMYYLHQGLSVQLRMMQTGLQLHMPAAEAAARWREHYWSDYMVPQDGSRDWPAMLRMLDKSDPSYRH